MISSRVELPLNNWSIVCAGAVRYVYCFPAECVQNYFPWINFLDFEFLSIKVLISLLNNILSIVMRIALDSQKLFWFSWLYRIEWRIGLSKLSNFKDLISLAMVIEKNEFAKAVLVLAHIKYLGGCQFWKEKVFSVVHLID